MLVGNVCCADLLYIAPTSAASPRSVHILVVATVKTKLSYTCAVWPCVAIVPHLYHNQHIVVYYIPINLPLFVSIVALCVVFYVHLGKCVFLLIVNIMYHLGSISWDMLNVYQWWAGFSRATLGMHILLLMNNSYQIYTPPTNFRKDRIYLGCEV